MDTISKEKRSVNMSKISSKNTKPEILVRKFFTKKGLRYRVHYNLPGKPDIVFPSKKIAIFVNGCFWHGHNCKNAHIPKTNVSFWKNKITKNKKRDMLILRKLKALGWTVKTFWECNIYEKVDSVYTEINRLF